MLPPNTLSSGNDPLSFPGHDGLGAERESVTPWSTRASFVPDLDPDAGIQDRTQNCAPGLGNQVGRSGCLSGEIIREA